MICDHLYDLGSMREILRWLWYYDFSSNYSTSFQKQMNIFLIHKVNVVQITQRFAEKRNNLDSNFDNKNDSLLSTSVNAYY